MRATTRSGFGYDKAEVWHGRPTSPGGIRGLFRPEGVHDGPWVNVQEIAKGVRVDRNKFKIVEALQDQRR